jgi:methionine synthase II (cobalamin-independent)
MEATGQDLVTDGEMRASSFAICPYYELREWYQLAGMLASRWDSFRVAHMTDIHNTLRKTPFVNDRVAIAGYYVHYYSVFEDENQRKLPCLGKGPFRYNTFAYENFKLSKVFATKPMKQAVVAPSMMYLTYPLSAEVRRYPESEFIKDVVSECVKDIRGCFDVGARRVSINFTEGRLGAKNTTHPFNDEWSGTNLLRTFVDLHNQVLDHFTAEERENIGIHACPGGKTTSHIYYDEILPTLFQINAGYFLIPLARVEDKNKVYKEIGARIRKDAKGVKQVAFIGVVNPLDPRVETAEEIRDALVAASNYIPKDQLGATDDCGFSAFPIDVKPEDGGPDFARDIAFQKIANRVKGAAMASMELGI